MPDYEPEVRLGEGNFGEVWLMFDRALGVKRAVKLVRPSKILDPTEFYREPQILMQLRHDNIVRVEDAGTNPDGTLYIAMEYLPHGSLESRFRGGPAPLSRARRFLTDVSWGLQYAHQQGFIHRDIKPANILIGLKGEGKLSDFGLATRAPRGQAASPYGYLTHLAPEVFQTDITNTLTDVYALGVTAYRLINGDKYLSVINTDQELIDLVIEGKYPDRTHYRPYVPRQVRQVINRAMNIEPAKRYQSAAAFRLALEGITLKCDWKWKLARGAAIYQTKVGETKFIVRVEEKQKERFEITTTKQASSGTTRRVAKDCELNLTRSQMKMRLHSILARYVSEGR